MGLQEAIAERVKEWRRGLACFRAAQHLPPPPRGGRVDCPVLLSALLPPFAGLALALAGPLSAAEARDDAEWTVFISQDNCPDYTWGLTESQVRQALADLVKGHLDQMRKTDAQPPENRDRYNATVAQEVLCFIEKYPDRKAELIARVKEGRLCVSPFLCNNTWAFNDVEGFLRTLYPARRLAREWGVAFEVALHSEEPSLPWGVASLLAGAGVRWLCVPFYNYDSTFGGLTNPPLFIYAGPDGRTIRVRLDPWASNAYSYTEGQQLLNQPGDIAARWLPHYRQLGPAYPLRATLASGTHGDISLGSGGQAAEFADKIMRYNSGSGAHPKLVNSTLALFCQAVDEVQARQPFMKTLRGCFGHSWDVWPVACARYAAGMREGERALLGAEALLAAAGRGDEKLRAATAPARERAEWCLAMLSDHAWNGTDEKNKKHNAGLRKVWNEELNKTAQQLQGLAWQAAADPGAGGGLAIFNPLSLPNRGLVRVPAPAVGAEIGVQSGGKAFPTQQVDGFWFIALKVPGFGFAQAVSGPVAHQAEIHLRATDTELEGPFYRLQADPKTGGITSLIHKASGKEFVAAGKPLFQMVYHDGKDHTLENVRHVVASNGPVLAKWQATGDLPNATVTTYVTLYAELDRVDFEVIVKKKPNKAQERLCHVFNVLDANATLRIETNGAVIGPRPQPEGDLLPGADTRRFAVQGFVDAESEGLGVTIVPLDAFVLRRDLDGLCFEALGNDQNYRESVQDQNGEEEFRFRYSLRARTGTYQGPETFAFARSAAMPLLVTRGKIKPELLAPPVTVDPARAIATCFKPADEAAAGGCILRLWETAGRTGPLTLEVPGFKRVLLCDLLEADQKELPVAGGKVEVVLPGHGFACLRLLP